MKDIIQNIGTLVMVFCCGIIVGLLIHAPAKVILLPVDHRITAELPSIMTVECCGMLEPDINTQVEMEYQQLLRDEDAALNQSFNSALSLSRDIHKWALPLAELPCSR